MIALALVFWVLQSPGGAALYQTFPLLIFAYVVHFGAQAMRAVAGRGRRGAPPPRGRGPDARRRPRPPLPHHRAAADAAGAAAGAGLVLLSTMKELPATLLLAPTGFETLATRIWSAAEEGFLAEAGLARSCSSRCRAC